MSRVVNRVLNGTLAGYVLAAALAGTATAATEAVVYSFQGGSDGDGPTAGLINVGGTLYGTTFGGTGCGTVFSVTQAGVEKVLHYFSCLGTDGQNPEGGLIDVGGTLYGVTESGGALGAGTVFSITRAGFEKVLYSFGTSGGYDGGTPSGALINVGGTLYGVATNGGANFLGTVFSVTPAGVENVLYSFTGKADGAGPVGGLIEVNGTLYGTTENGGGRCANSGCGTVFSVTLAGVETVLHAFAGSDGSIPVGSLVYIGGTFYGTTEAGGMFADCRSGCGTVFSLTPAGVEKVLHSFGGFPGGRAPYASLLAIADQLYGTAEEGGAQPAAQKMGTVFSITRGGPQAGVMKVLHSFFGTNDGADPYANVIDVGGTFYGTTSRGGAYGHGTVFKVTP